MYCALRQCRTNGILQDEQKQIKYSQILTRAINTHVLEMY